MKRIVLDQGLPSTAAIILREDDWDAVHAREIEMQEASDTEILDYAARESRVVITLDRDFPQILALTAATRPSVVLIRQQRLRAPEVAALIASIWREHEHALDHGCVLKVSARGTRTRLLPLS
jgi:predicted nuclease of predicted toxin-antitoxin system